MVIMCTLHMMSHKRWILSQTVYIIYVYVSTCTVTCTPIIVRLHGQYLAVLPHLSPIRTGQPACRVSPSPWPFLWRFHQKRAAFWNTRHRRVCCPQKIKTNILPRLCVVLSSNAGQNPLRKSEIFLVFLILGQKVKLHKPRFESWTQLRIWPISTRYHLLIQTLLLSFLLTQLYYCQQRPQEILKTTSR